MKVIVTENYEEMSDRAFEIMSEVVKANPTAVLGLATGSTPIGLYQRMIADHRDHGTSYRGIKTINLDEYAGLTADDPHSYAYFMKDNLFDHIDIDPRNTNIENGVATDPVAECARYDALSAALRQDIQILGIGENGHIAFNEPGTSFDSTTHCVKLTESTIRANARLFDRMEDVPRAAYTMGIKNIMNAKKILLLASGEKKADAVYALLHGEVTEGMPASILSKHPDCIVIADRDAAKKIR